MKESFGSDGQPGSYADIDECDAMFLFGHNTGETQTVLLMRVLDRLAGPNPPQLVCVDPRETEVARKATVHLAVRPGTNLALMHGLVRELIVSGGVDAEYVAERTMGFEDVRAAVEKWTPERVAHVCGVDAADVRRAAQIFIGSERVLSTVLQGVYQSSQSTASACQVNNLHLLTGKLGRPGSGILQMNGQPTWENSDHVQELSATNPAVSMPHAERFRKVLGTPGLFLVVQDLYLTETARMADVVLPAAAWGEKLGTFTNVNRTVHLSEKAIDAPGEARSDLDIFLDYSRRMDLRRDDGAPLLDWSGPEDGFRAWQACTKGRLCDYTGISYDRLRGGSGIPWPCNEDSPEGTVRLYGNGIFPTEIERAETFGHDLLTGATVGPQAYKAMRVDGRALLEAAAYAPAHELPRDEYPLQYSTGEISRQDAEELDIEEGDIVRVTSPRGVIVVPAPVGDIRAGTVFAPFHYGYWEEERSAPGAHAAAAKELTMTEWDPVSKQPIFTRRSARTRHAGGDAMNVDLYLGLLHKAEQTLATSFRQIADGHGSEPDVFQLCHTLAQQCDDHVDRLEPIIERYGERPDSEPDRSQADALTETRSGPVGLLLLRDLQNVNLFASLVDITWVAVTQGALALCDEELLSVVASCESETKVHLSWLSTRMKQAVPQALLVAT